MVASRCIQQVSSHFSLFLKEMASNPRRRNIPPVTLNCTESALGLHPTVANPPDVASSCESCSHIMDGLYLGSWRDAEDAQFLQAQGITHVLNVAKEVNIVPMPVKSLGLAFKCVPISDCHDAADDLKDQFIDAFEFIDGARRSGGRCLVHCRRGISRSPAVVIGYLMKEQGGSYTQSLDFVQTRRKINLNLGFRSMLEEFRPENRLSEVGRHASSSSIGPSSTEEVAPSLTK